ncbi:MAG: DUF3842 family protein [Clostridiales bacterium]|nr:DUF3842 family protein [Clostridiales bacterium]
MNILVIDGQGGSLGKLLTQEIKKTRPDCRVTAVGTNSIATAAMLKAGADAGATGENPVIVCCAECDVIMGPLGLLSANAMLGEITPAMARAVGESKARKILVPVSKCSVTVAGVRQLSYAEYVAEAISEI